MTGAALIGEALAYGVVLSVENGAIVWEARDQPPMELLDKLARNREAVIAAVAGEDPESLLDPEHRAVIEAWLDHIRETDSSQRHTVIRRCATDPKALECALKLARDAGLIVEPTVATQQSTAVQVSSPSPLESVSDLPLLSDDKTFLLKLLEGKPLPVREQRLSGYRRVWLEASEQEVMAHRQENKGRKAANTWIRLASQGGDACLRDGED